MVILGQCDRNLEWQFSFIGGHSLILGQCVIDKEIRNSPLLVVILGQFDIDKEW